MEFSASAGLRSSAPTIDGISEEKAGADKASVMPTTEDNAMIIQILTHPPDKDNDHQWAEHLDALEKIDDQPNHRATDENSERRPPRADCKQRAGPVRTLPKS
jgi:hypothetical protein